MAKAKKKGAKVNYKQQRRQKDKQEKQVLAQKRAMQDSGDNAFTLQLQAYDTWFFRESRPHDAVGASELSSLFPPPIRTLAGALRTYLGDQLEIDWKTLNCKDHDFDFEKSLGNAEHLGDLQLKGPWVCYQGKRLYPVPLYLMQKDTEIQRLVLGNAVRCDLGVVRLPEMPEGCQGYKTMEQHWLTATGLRACLEGKTPSPKDVIKTNELFVYESRLGIARDNATRSVQEGKLYQTQHLRLKEAVHIELDARHVAPCLLDVLPSDKRTILRLGGEGRMASAEILQEHEALPFTNPKKVSRFMIHFITPADFGGVMFPEGFHNKDQNGQTVWQGTLNGIAFSIEAAVIGKAHREGGWDMKNHQPRAVKSYIPAGSAWYCQLAESTQWQILGEALHGIGIGNDTAYGRGQILIGQWLDNQLQNKEYR